MKTQKIKTVKKEQFNNLYYKSLFKNKKNWQGLFNDTIKQIDNFSSSLSFWYVADFEKGVVKVGGDYKTATPLNEKNWIGLNPWDIGKLFHPLDLNKMQAFVVFIANMLAQKTNNERKKIKISLIFRMLNSKKKYTWRKMEYPAMYYEKKEPRYLLCHVSEIEHLITQPKCIMYILDAVNNEPTMFYCEDEHLKLKPLNAQKPLSQREIEILKLLVKGLISKEIAEILKISKNTVENHKQNIFQKTGTKKATELVNYANNFLFQP